MWGGKDVKYHMGSVHITLHIVHIQYCFCSVIFCSSCWHVHKAYRHTAQCFTVSCKCKLGWFFVFCWPPLRQLQSRWRWCNRLLLIVGLPKSKVQSKILFIHVKLTSIILLHGSNDKQIAFADHTYHHKPSFGSCMLAYLLCESLVTCNMSYNITSGFRNTHTLCF